ncbi:hypothetical protein HHI36_004241 [Cryptolaemus montrouzieri]|uniref:Uncharacterized protein n=1 Tax=Cryptolaemus montrouzieri TaxID=559131 RepID=A0ABD2NQL2_9CUCU
MEKALDTDALKSPNIMNMFKNKVASLEDENDNAHSCEKLKAIIMDTAEETLPTIEKEKSRDWFDEECKLINERKSRAYRQIVQKHYTRNADDEYREIRRQEDRYSNRRKESIWRRYIKILTTLKSRRCRDENGELINGNTEILKRWRNRNKTALEGKVIKLL